MDEVLTINVGADVTLVRGTHTYKGTLQKQDERYFLKLKNSEPNDPDEITIHIKT